MALATLTVRTAHLPDLPVDLDLPEGEAEGSWIWKFLRPAFRVDTPLGSYSKAPWGDPGESTWPVGAGLAVLALGLLFLGIAALGRKYL